MNYNIEILNESGYEEAMLGLSLSFNQPVSNMKGVSDRLYDKDGGHNKFLESVCVWLDITMPRYWWQEFAEYRVGRSSQSECYDSNTEILTNSGWKFFKDLNYTDKVCTLTKDKFVEYHIPDKIIYDNYSGEMYKFKTKTIDLLVTPNHRMVTKARRHDSIKIKYAKDITKSDIFFKRTNGSSDGIDSPIFILDRYQDENIVNNKKFGDLWDEKHIPMDLWLKFLGVWLSEGFCSGSNGNYITSVCQSEESPLTSKIDDIFNKLPFKYQRYVEQRDGKQNTVIWKILNKQLFNHLSVYTGACNKRIPSYVKKLCNRQLKIIEEYLMLGDGTTKNNKYQYISTSKQLINDVQEIWLKLGYTSGNRIHHKEDRNIKTCYITTRYSTDYSYLNKKAINKITYNGKIGCVSVKNGIVCVRRNGIISWSGNSTMHTITKRELTQNDFVSPIYEGTLEELNMFIRMYNNTDDKDSKNKYFKEIKNNLPEGFLQRRVLCTNYKTLRHIISQRKNHKLDEWKAFCTYLKSNLRYKEWLKDL